MAVKKIWGGAEAEVKVEVEAKRTARLAVDGP
jgi:hypothetical protein